MSEESKGLNEYQQEAQGFLAYVKLVKESRFGRKKNLSDIRAEAEKLLVLSEFGSVEKGLNLLRRRLNNILANGSR